MKKDDKTAIDYGIQGEDKEKNGSSDSNLQPISNGGGNELDLEKEAQKYEIDENPLNRLSDTKSLDNKVFPYTDRNNLKIESNTTSTYGFSCYYCDFDTSSQDDYEKHVVVYHSKRPGYPSIEDLKRSGLKPQGKSWEV